ncbi:Transcriptional regulator, LysR family [hydrothermal vent metagenome]|uniref:Transcriptional regulator, LysR family n=1 Tax=hydrothermal vent metagenome TaxID=652676 RepID=A0A3B0T7F4_9ZZZZ
MDWDKMRIFYAVGEAGSFTRAGEELGLSQSAVSRQISTLEADLNVPLFHRHARGLIPTEQGELLLRTAQNISEQLRVARARLTDTRKIPSGPLRVTTTVGLGSAWLTPRIKGFIEQFPDIELELLLTDSELDLAMRQADIAIRLRQPVQPDLIQRRLFTVHFHIYASADYLKRHGTPQTLEDLDSHKIVTYGHPPAYLRSINWLTTAGRDKSPRAPVLRINNIDGLKEAVVQGIGLAMLPDYTIGANSGLVRVSIAAKAPEFDTYLVYAEEQRESKRISVFCEFLVSNARNWSY